jgi:GT2 family glycosyltransferase
MTPTAIVVVNFNTREHLSACLDTLRGQNASRVVVVDNASLDGSVEMVRERHPGVELVPNPRNRGYGQAANQAVRACTEPHVLVLNADIRLAAGAVAALSAYLDEHPEAAVVGPRLVKEDGTLQPSALPFPRPITLRPLVRHVPLLREWYLPTWGHSRARAVPYVLGAALCIRRAAFEEVGGFDPEFFLFYEEVDLCLRLRRAGWQVHFAPVTTVVHTGGASTGQHPETARAERAEAERRFYDRWYSGERRVAVIALRNLVAAVRDARDRLRPASRRAAGDPGPRASRPPLGEPDADGCAPGNPFLSSASVGSGQAPDGKRAPS